MIIEDQEDYPNSDDSRPGELGTAAQLDEYPRRPQLSYVSTWGTWCLTFVACVVIAALIVWKVRR